MVMIWLYILVYIAGIVPAYRCVRWEQMKDYRRKVRSYKDEMNTWQTVMDEYKGLTPEAKKEWDDSAYHRSHMLKPYAEPIYFRTWYQIRWATWCTLFFNWLVVLRYLLIQMGTWVVDSGKEPGPKWL